MTIVRAMRPRSERAASGSILGGLALLTIAAWAATLRQAAAGDALMMAGVPMSLEMSGRWGFSSAVAFLFIWIVMMVAMMFPSVWPVVLTYRAVILRRGRGSVPFFLAGYLLAWEGFGILAYAGYIGAGVVLASTNALGGRLPLLTGVVVIVAGLYQFTPLKRACLAHCQGPVEYLASHWRGGAGGALRMGLANGGLLLGVLSGVDARPRRTGHHGSPVDGDRIRRDRRGKARAALAGHPCGGRRRVSAPRDRDCGPAAPGRGRRERRAGVRVAVASHA